MAKLTLKEFANWIGLSPESITLAKQIVEVSDPDGAYTHLQDMGEEEAAEAVEAIWFEYGSLKDAISACKEDLGLIGESKKTKKVTLKEFKEIVKNIIREEKEKETLPKVDSKDKQKVINQLKSVYKYSQQESEKLVKENPNMNATAIHKKVKEDKLKGGK